MGLFTSYCPEPTCNNVINWFGLNAPKNYVCKCGRQVSQKEIEDSWQKVQYEHHKNSIKRCLDKGMSVEEICKRWNRDYVLPILADIKAESNHD